MTMLSSSPIILNSFSSAAVCCRQLQASIVIGNKLWIGGPREQPLYGVIMFWL